MDARLDLDIAVDEIEKAVSPDLLLLFGSAAAGRMRADSDIDLAYYGGKPLSAYERFLLAQKLAGRLGREVDLVDLKEASTVMQMQILSEGHTLRCKDEDLDLRLRTQVYKMYAKLNEERSPVLRSIRERGSIYEA